MGADVRIGRPHGGSAPMAYVDNPAVLPNQQLAFSRDARGEATLQDSKRTTACPEFILSIFDAYACVFQIRSIRPLLSWAFSPHNKERRSCLPHSTLFTSSN